MITNKLYPSKKAKFLLLILRQVSDQKDIILEITPKSSTRIKVRLRQNRYIGMNILS